MKNKLNKKIWEYCLISLVVILIIGLLYIFYVFITVDGRIVEDKPLVKFMCNLHINCEVSTGGKWGCQGLDDVLKEGKITKYEAPNAYELSKWSGYKGCNESTKGYQNGYISNIESCSCQNVIG